MPGSRVIENILEAYSLPKKLEEKVFEEAQKRLSPSDTFNEIFDYTVELIKKAKKRVKQNKSLRRKKREEQEKQREEQEKQRAVSLYQRIRENNGETRDEFGRFSGIPYKKLLKLIVAFPIYMTVSGAAREAGITRKTARKYLTSLGFKINKPKT